MTQITRVPFGLQDFLGSKNFGDNPSDLSGVVAPILNLWPFLSMERRAHVITAGAVNVAGSTSGQQIDFWIVPDGELWLVEMVGMTADIGAVTSGNNKGKLTVFASQLQGSDNPTVQHPLAFLGQFDNQNGANVSATSYTKWFPHPVTFSPGEIIEFWVTDVNLPGGSDMDLRASVRFLRLSI